MFDRGGCACLLRALALLAVLAATGCRARGYTFGEFVGARDSRPHWRAAMNQPVRHGVSAALAASSALVQIDSRDRRWQRRIAARQVLPGSEENKASDVGFFGLAGAALIAPVLFPPKRGVPGERRDRWKYFATNAYALTANAAINGAVRAANLRTRPSGSRGSYYSGHTAGSFTAATLLHREYGWRVGVPAYVAASLVAGYRVEADRHWPGDVLMGAAAGMFIANVIYDKNHGDAGLFADKAGHVALMPLLTPDLLGFQLTVTW